MDLQAEGRQQTVQKGVLGVFELFARLAQAKKSRAIDFQELLHAAGARRPFHAEGIANVLVGVIDVPGEGPTMHGLTALLPD